MSVRILLADDHKILREGLRSMLEKAPDMEVIGEAEDGMAAIRLAREFNPDIIIMDVSMPGMDGIDTTRQILKEFPDTKIIGLSMYSKKSFVIEMLKAGASGYILKDSAFAELVNAIKAVLAGEVFLCTRITAIVVDSYVHNHDKTTSTDTTLTDRERQVLKMLAEGKPSKEIALLLGLSAKTVDACRRQIMKKLDIKSVAELVKYAIRQGITTIDAR